MNTVNLLNVIVKFWEKLLNFLHGIEKNEMKLELGYLNVDVMKNKQRM